jgi:hypothetical protein
VVSDELISVDPDRCNAAAGELETLRDVLAANVPVITQILEEYWSSGVGNPVSLAVLTKARTVAPADAATMRTRERLAAIAASGPQALAYSIDGMVTIPGSTGDENTLDAQEEVQALAQAEKSGDRATIQAIEQDIQDHLDEGDSGTTWLSAFYNGAGPQVAGLASSLHDEDATGITLLTPQDEQILSTYASGLAAVDKAGKLQQSTITQLTAGPTLWSATMLLKYGPPGSAYGTQSGFADGKNGQNGQPAQIQQGLLAQMTDAVYTSMQNGTYTVPVNWGSAESGSQLNQLQAEMADANPLDTMMQLDAQNQVAAGQVLGGPDGGSIAKTLEQQQFLNWRMEDGPHGETSATFAGFGDTVGGLFTQTFPMNQQDIANFLDAATVNPSDPGQSPPRGSDAISYASAQAAINIINNAPAASSINLTEPIRQAFLTTFGRYLPDLASSTNYDASQASGWPQLTPGGGAFSLQLDGSDALKGGLANFMQDIETNSHDAGVMQGEIASAMGNQFALQATGQGQNPLSSDLAGDMAKLYGSVITQQQNLHYSQKQAEDAANAEINTIVSMAETGAGLIPGGTALTTAQHLLSLGTPLIPTLSTDNASQQAASDLQTFAQDEGTLNVPMVQGLINSGVVKPPADASWYQNGQIDPNGQFETWWQLHKGYWINELPQYNEPPYMTKQPGTKPLAPNPTNTQTMESWQNLYAIANMNLIRQMQTEEGN